jgi:hypothetical protein
MAKVQFQHPYGYREVKGDGKEWIYVPSHPLTETRPGHWVLAHRFDAYQANGGIAKCLAGGMELEWRQTKVINGQIYCPFHGFGAALIDVHRRVDRPVLPFIRDDVAEWMATTECGLIQ